MSSFGKVVGTIALLALAAVGLLMSLCGGVVTVNGLAMHGMAGILVISVPSLVVGLAAVWFAVKKLRGRVGRPPES